MLTKAGLIKIGAFLVVLIVGIYFAYNLTIEEEHLPVYNPSDVNKELVDSSLWEVKKMHRIADFHLIDQSGKAVSQKDFENSVYVADFFFTTCQTICPKMTGQMQRVHETYMENPRVKLLSHTVMPEVDTVEILAAYAEERNVDPSKWHFVTGDKAHIYEMARKSYFAVTSEGAGDEFDFIHTENFILIDKEKRIRGFYDGTSTEEVDQLISDIKILLHEYEQ